MKNHQDDRARKKKKQRENNVSIKKVCHNIKNFCMAGTYEDWSVFKQRQSHQQLVASTKREYAYACFLWNHKSSEKIELPNLEVKVPNTPDRSFKFRFRKCILTAAPTAPQCLVLFLMEDMLSLYFCRVGHKRWTHWRYDEDKEEEYILLDAITYNKNIYALNQIGQLCEIVADDLHQLRLCRYDARLPLSSDLFNKEQLVDCCDNLVVVRRRSIFKIEVYIMDFSRRKWKKVKHKDNRAIVLVGDYSTSFSTVEHANTIFFTHNNDDESLYSFNLAEKSLSVWRNHPNSGPLWVLQDEMMPVVRFPDKPRHGQQIINGEDGTIQETAANEIKRESLWFRLPADIQKLIVQHIPTISIPDYMNCRAVCKKWRSMFGRIRWEPSYTGRGICNPIKYPWLMLSKGQGMYSFCDPICNFTYSIRIPELYRCNICYSKQGWLLVKKGPTIFFFEPFTRTMIELPDLWDDDRCDGFCFSDLPSSPEWIIFGISHVSQEKLEILYLRSGDEDWTSQTLWSNRLPPPSFSNPVFDGQSFCYLGNNGNVVFFNLQDDETGFNWHVEFSLLLFYSSYSRRYLICYENELLSVFVDQMGSSTHVFKLDKRAHKWVEIKSLEKHILYVSQSTCLCVEAMEQEMRNTIQFPMLAAIHDHDNGNNVFFSLKERIFQTYDGHKVHPWLANLYDTKEILHSTWIQPLVVPEIAMTI